MRKARDKSIGSIHGDDNLFGMRAKATDDAVGLSITGVGDEEIHGRYLIM